MNHRGTWDNIRLVVTCLVLLYNNYITADEIRLAIDAYTLQCLDREKRSDFSVEYLELTFETIAKALRVSPLQTKLTFSVWFSSWAKPSVKLSTMPGLSAWSRS